MKAKVINQTCNANVQRVLSKTELPDPRKTEELICLANKLDDISKTAFGTVYYRSKYSHTLKHPFIDLLGEKILQTLNYTHPPRDEYSLAFAMIIAPIRTKVIDDITSDFIKANYRDAVIINLGCGLCTRLERLLAEDKLDPKNIVWINVDLQNMISFRTALWNTLSPHTEGFYLPVSSSVFDFEWIKIAKSYKNRPILLISEGCLSYYEEKQIKIFFEILRKNFSSLNILLTAVHPELRIRELSNKLKTTPNHKWFVKSSEEVVALNSDLRLISTSSFLNMELLKIENIPSNILDLAASLPRNYSTAIMMALRH